MRDCGTFDYVIVGGGSAGCVLANRLSASGTQRVLLLEAGGEDRNPWIHIPLGYGKLFKNAKVNWLYESEPEPELNGRRIIQPRGKVLGGSSSINGCIYIRGQKEDFDHWRQLGNVGWSYDDVLPYFKKAEDQERGADAFHGAGGPLCVSDQRDPHELCEAFIAAAEQTGIPRNDDFNGARQEGAGYFQTTTRRGRRCSAAVAYLRPARRRPNLRVLTQAPTTRVLFEGREAVGVAFQHQGETWRALADAEIILAAGAIATPPLLQLSSVGPAALLQRFGIGVVHELRGVGEDLQDHLQARLGLSLHAADHAQRRCRKPGAQIRHRHALRALPQGPARGERRLCRRLLPHRSASRHARRAVPLHQFQHDQDGRQAAPLLGLHRVDLPAAAGEPRLRAHQERRSRGAAGDPAQLPRRGERSPHHGGRAEAAAPHHAGAGDAPLYRVRV